MNARWTIRVDRMPISLAVGVHPDEVEPQAMWVSVSASGDAAASPGTLTECIDYDPLCRWLTEVWPRTAHVRLLEIRINELLERVFGLDPAVQEAWVGLYKQRYGHGANLVGIERRATRCEFERQVMLTSPTLKSRDRAGPLVHQPAKATR